MCSIEYTQSMVSNGLAAFDLGAVNSGGNTITAQVLYFGVLYNVLYNGILKHIIYDTSPSCYSQNVFIIAWS